MTKLTILLLYMIAAGALIRALFAQQQKPQQQRLREGGLKNKSALHVGIVLAALAFSAHTVAIWQALHSPDGVFLGLANVAGLLGWQIGLFSLIAIVWAPLRGVGALLLPVAAISVFPGLDEATAGSVPRASWQVQSHVVFSLLSYGLFTLAALLALMMRTQERAIRRGRPGRFIRLMPPLEAAERALFFCIGAGFALLSLGIFSGLVFIDNLMAQHLAHKTILSLLGWLVFATLLVGRWRFGWRGETAAGWTLAGFFLLILAYFGSRFVLEVLLGRQWNL